MEIEVISLPASATEPLKMPDYIPSLTATLARIDGSGTHDINRLCASLERMVDVSLLADIMRDAGFINVTTRIL
jgi:hypothetical protein